MPRQTMTTTNELVQSELCRGGSEENGRCRTKVPSGPNETIPRKTRTNKSRAGANSMMTTDTNKNPVAKRLDRNSTAALNVTNGVQPYGAVHSRKEVHSEDDVHSQNTINNRDAIRRLNAKDK